MTKQPTILVVDDEPSILHVLQYNLEKAHYRVLVAGDGKQALDIAKVQNPDLILLDLMLPGLDGFEVCRQIRRACSTPIIMLTALDTEVDRVVGLELGADDYVVKPFSMRELMARVKAVLRRVQAEPPTGITRMTHGNLQLDPSRHESFWDERLLDLSPLEFELLATFMRHPGQALSREQLMDQVWGYDFLGDTRVVDTAIKRLRAKLREASEGASELLQTVRGVGYKLSDD